MECAICYENVNLGKYQKQPCCKHVFHWSCLVEWYTTLYNINKELNKKLNNSEINCNFHCPMCRTINKIDESIEIDEYIPKPDLSSEEIHKKKILNYISKRLDINFIISREIQINNVRLIYQTLLNNIEYFLTEPKFLRVVLKKKDELFEKILKYKNENIGSKSIENDSDNTIKTLLDFKNKVNGYGIKFDSNIC